MKQPSCRTIARKTFGKRTHLNIDDGSNGPFALVSLCRHQGDYSLQTTLDGAEAYKCRLGCGDAVGNAKG